MKLLRGVRLLIKNDRPAAFGVEWRVNGKRKAKYFHTREQQREFARGLGVSLRTHGELAFQHINNPDFIRLRTFVSQLGEGVDLNDVLACWKKHGQGSAVASVPLSVAVTLFLEAKATEGISIASLGHIRPMLRHFVGFAGEQTNVGSLSAEVLIKYFLTIKGFAIDTRQTYHKKLSTFFNWLKATKRLAENPIDGIKLPRKLKEEIRPVTVLTVADAERLFAANVAAPQARELLGRLALETFAGVRHETVAKIDGAMMAEVFDFKNRVITLPARISKLGGVAFIEHAEPNLWAWLQWSDPATWVMHKRFYANAKSAAFLRANVPHPHNVLRHSAASYHIALHGDAGKTAAMLTHRGNTQMLFTHYRGAGGGKDNAEKWFAIRPSSVGKSTK